MTINFAWMFTIVWLPIPTALVGGLDLINEHTGAYDVLLVTLYAGTMALSSLLLFLLFTLAAVLAALLPAVNLLSMWLLVLTGPLHTVLLRRLKPLQQQP